jgi:predicted dehydrogenase
MKIGICGVGHFGNCFVPLFQAHPLVCEVVLADEIEERVRESAELFGIERTFGSLDELCDSDVDAIALFTQRQLHGGHAIQALKAGKHVYSAVPAASSIEHLAEMVDIVERTGLLYMTGETSYYYPATIYCRERFQAGDFGRFAYAEAQYLHDMEHFYSAFESTGRSQWKRIAGLPPMYYPTHSTSMVLSVTDAHVTHVACLGFVDDHEDEIFRVGNNDWDNVFSNEFALMRTSDGGALRINEMRRVGWSGNNGVYMSFFGTEGAFEENGISSCFSTRTPGSAIDLTETLECEGMVGHLHLPESLQIPKGSEYYAGTCSIHPTDRLPPSFKGKPNGHFGSHQFLVDDFVRAWSEGSVPPCNVWNSANWCAPGLVAHESAKRDGQLMEVPSWRRPGG